jgi:hypothetical protein
MTTATIETARLDVAVEVVKRLGKYRAIEAGNPVIPPIENPLGEGYTGVDDYNGKTYRARIRVCDALNGCDKRVTLGRFDDADCAAYAYRVAHTALYGSYSWAASSLCDGEKTLIEMTRRAVLAG